MSAIKQDDMSQISSIQMNNSLSTRLVEPKEECKLMKRPQLHKITMGSKYASKPFGADDDSVIYSGDDADNEQ